ncbi:hypothetical protein GQ457_17G013270 [Hibiscus cannabinus]
MFNIGFRKRFIPIVNTLEESNCSKSSSQDLLKSGKAFSNKRVSVILDEMNYLLWKQQILLTVRSHRLEKLFLGKLKPPPETVQNDEGETVSNDDYEVFLAQDSALASWLLSTISAPLLPQFVGAEIATDVWSTVVQFFANRSTTSVMTLHCKLRSIRKGEESMQSYLIQIKEVCDTLSACGSFVSDIEQIATILNGLSIEYQSFVVVITTSKPSFTLDAVKSTLVDTEAQIKGFNAQMQLPVSAKVAQVQKSNVVAYNKGGLQQNRQQSSGGRFGARG